ncbi:Zn-dependent hydrolase [Prochlorococcus sp. SS52]|nr:Zn-dependent hydrolase [Prochlorococcus marinus str. LG]KGG20715.1 Zn-dependent hydrolase [Prochlorococcus marinus str. SS2]KGG25116.1 Zn-dependent hydrolase [Prochlorococcus marinus str. SS35]KGG33332.1 Zn-dependent hydrolase [Prochlorococcus marinus str. SS51]KGG35562.1 Zn-dependent hydrolase [Prochlorococcus sp. SS52]
MYVEYLNTRLLIDPWLIGSCYWKSWWNYPEPSQELIDSIEPTHIYITHLHWDHYHGPSLRRFQKFKPKILLPRHFNTRMLDDCRRSFSFDDILEIDHAKKIEIGKDFRIASYQFNPYFIDSSLVIEADNTSLLNANDSKVFGLSLKQIISNHPSFDFVFRSHSSASPLPHCMRGSDPDKSTRAPVDYANEFTYFAKSSKAKYAIPFASSHFHLHSRTRKFNQFYSNPDLVKKVYDSKKISTQTCVIMPSGSTWSNAKGFDIVKHDYSLIDQHVIEYLQIHQHKFTKQNAKESKLRLNRKAFHAYFEKFLYSITIPFLIKFTFAFLIEQKLDEKLLLCIVDPRNNSTYIKEIGSEDEIYQYNLAFVICLPIYVFNDCNTKKMYNTFAASKLLEIIPISQKAESNFSTFLNLVDFYENDCLPLTKIISLRNFKIMISRWRELLDALFLIYILKLKRGKIQDLYK